MILLNCFLLQRACKNQEKKQEMQKSEKKRRKTEG
jgi:hypothetical protein